MGSQPIQLLKTDGIPYLYQSIKDGNGRDVVKAEVEQLCCWEKSRGHVGGCMENPALSMGRGSAHLPTGCC